MIEIESRRIGRGEKPFVIAEMSGNHNQSLDRALAIVAAAAAAGADALKIQTYTAETMTLDVADREFYVSDNESLWKKRSLYDLYAEAHTPWEWHSAIFDYARKCGLIPFSTPFDETAVDFLETLNVPCYKIASFENTDIPLIRRVAKTGKPIIISTGMASLGELDEAVSAAREAGCTKLILLKCTSSYPASPKDSNIQTIAHMHELFSGCEIGISDHTMGVGVAVASIALGATVIEKHFTLCRADGGVDSAFSMEPEEMASLVVEVNRAWEAVGQVAYGPTQAEKKSLAYRRSLYITKDLSAGEKLTPDNLRAIRPGLGLAPKYIEIVLGKKVNQTVKRGTPLSWDMVG